MEVHKTDHICVTLNMGKMQMLYLVLLPAVFFVRFPKHPKIDGNDKKRSRLFLEFSFVLATQSNSKSSEDVSQIIEPE